jgi:hypothetical protein
MFMFLHQTTCTTFLCPWPISLPSTSHMCNCMNMPHFDTPGVVVWLLAMSQGRAPQAVQLDADSVFAYGSIEVPSIPEQPVADLSKARVLRLGRARPRDLDPSQILYLDVALEGGALHCS